MEDCHVVRLNHDSSFGFFDNLKNCLDAELFTDVTLVCGKRANSQTNQRKSLRANASVLAASSSFFHSLLNNRLGQDYQILLPDYTYEEVASILRYCYTGKFERLVENAEKLAEDFKLPIVSEDRYEEHNEKFDSLEKNRAKTSKARTQDEKICNICGKCFARPALLANHQRIHTGERPFQCEICPKSFKEKSHLTRHEKSHGQNARPYTCSICSKHFANRFYLSQHELSHSGYKRLLCSVCGYRCFQASDLKKHMRTHTGEKPYKCKYCEKSFTQKVSCGKHMRTVHKDLHSPKCDNNKV